MRFFGRRWKLSPRGAVEYGSGMVQPFQLRIAAGVLLLAALGCQVEAPIHEAPPEDVAPDAAWIAPETALDSGAEDAVVDITPEAPIDVDAPDIQAEPDLVEPPDVDEPEWPEPDTTWGS